MDLNKSDKTDTESRPCRSTVCAQVVTSPHQQSCCSLPHLFKSDPSTPAVASQVTPFLQRPRPYPMFSPSPGLTQLFPSPVPGCHWHITSSPGGTADCFFSAWFLPSWPVPGLYVLPCLSPSAPSSFSCFIYLLPSSPFLQFPDPSPSYLSTSLPLNLTNTRMHRWLSINTQ